MCPPLLTSFRGHFSQTGDKLASVNGHDTAAMPYSTASRIMTAFLRQMGPTQPLVLGFTRNTAALGTTVASLVSRRTVDEGSVTRRQSMAPSSQHTLSGDGNPVAAGAEIVNVDDLRGPLDRLSETSSVLSARREVAPVKYSDRDWVTGTVKNGGSKVSRDSAMAPPPLRARTPNPPPAEIRRYNYTPESEDYMMRRASQAIERGVQATTRKQPGSKPLQQQTRTRSLSAGRALVEEKQRQELSRGGHFDGYRTKTAAILMNAYDTSRRRETEADQRRRRSSSRGSRGEPVYERLYRQSFPQDVEDLPEMVYPDRHVKKGILKSSARPTQPHPSVAQPRGREYVTQAQRTRRPPSQASGGSSGDGIWEDLYHHPDTFAARNESDVNRLMADVRNRAASRDKSRTSRSLSRPRDGDSQATGDVPSYARPLKRHLMIGTATPVNIEEGAMTPHGATKTWAAGLRDTSQTPRRLGLTTKKSEGRLDDVSHITENASSARPAPGRRMSVKELARERPLAQQIQQQNPARNGRALSRGVREVERSVSRSRSRSRPREDLTLSRGGVVTRQPSQQQKQQRPTATSRAPVRSRYSQHAIADERRRARSQSRPKSVEPEFDSGSDLVSEMTHDVMAQLQQERDEVTRQSSLARPVLKKVAARGHQAPVSVMSESQPQLSAASGRQSGLSMPKSAIKPTYSGDRLSVGDAQSMLELASVGRADSTAPPMPDIVSDYSWPVPAMSGSFASKPSQSKGDRRRSSQESLVSTLNEDEARWSVQLFKAGMLAAATTSSEAVSDVHSHATPSPDVYFGGASKGQRASLSLPYPLYEV